MSAKKRQSGFASVWRIFHKQQKITLFLLAAIVIAVPGIAISRYVNYLDKWSDKDYAAVESTAEKTLKTAGGGNVQKYEDCYYAASEKYSSVRLYCEIELATFVPYESDNQVRVVVRNLETEASKMGLVNSYLSDISNNPRDASSMLSVQMKPPLPNQSCNFEMATGIRGADVGTHIKDMAERDVIGIAFQCTNESRAEYFPVTYRQN